MGQGIATRVVAAMTEAAFSVDGVDHFEIRYDAANAARRRPLTKRVFT
jgi:RimJ/RimL family protein N-acetyltransferase